MKVYVSDSNKDTIRLGYDMTKIYVVLDDCYLDSSNYENEGGKLCCLGGVDNAYEFPIAGNQYAVYLWVRLRHAIA